MQHSCCWQCHPTHHVHITIRRACAQVVTTISRGRLVWHNGRLDVQPGSGRYAHVYTAHHVSASCARIRYVARTTHGPLFEGLTARDANWIAEQFPYGPTPVLRVPVRVVRGADGAPRVEPEIAAHKDEL